MLTQDLFTKDGAPRGSYLLDTLATEAGRMTLIYILTKLGAFNIVEGAESVAVRNAAVRLLNDITAQTGLVLDIGLVRTQSV